VARVEHTQILQLKPGKVVNFEERQGHAGASTKFFSLTADGIITFNRKSSIFGIRKGQKDGGTP
jgi:hypothetical protein